jgi:hypothetical protein
MSLQWRVLPFVLISLVLTGVAYGDGAAFDLSGPRVEINVTRAGKTLPISEVPNLQPGDRLWLHPDLPEGQSVHYLMVATFLRGSTNPPPENWFTKAETWNKQVREEGIVVTVPKDAQQALLFLAPETGGDIGSLRSAVRGRPGAFVRASQDLEQASLNRTRLEEYLKAVRESSSDDPKALKDRSALLARSLGIRVNQDCFDRPAEQQISCLTQNTDQLVLDDAHTQSMVSNLTSGAASDLIGHVSSAPLAGGGYYSPYVGAVVDLARLMGSFHSAQYQYIPALALPKQGELNLKLNNPPSFRKPMSVLVIALPPVEAEQLPPLHSVSAEQVSCLQKSPLVLPVEGAPLVFSTAYAHGMVLHVHAKSGQDLDLPATADAARGGFVIDTSMLPGAKLDPEASGSLQGLWGFESFRGPTFQLRNAHPAKWTIASAAPVGLVVGQDDPLHLQSEEAACVDGITVKDPQGKISKTGWKLLDASGIQVDLSLKNAEPGTFTLLMKQAGLAKPDEVPVHTYSAAAHLEHFVFHAGDRMGVLQGNHLGEVENLQLKGIHFAPETLSQTGAQEELQLAAPNDAALTGLAPGEKLMADVALKDGRLLHLSVTIEPPRPKLTLLSKDVQHDSASDSADLRLANQDDLPQNARLSFFLKTEAPADFPRDEKVEVATADGSSHVLLSLAEGSLILQDSHTVLAVLDPLKSFGPSVFGLLRFRPVNSGAAGDWQPLANLVRIPSLKEVRCPDNPEKPCTLIGSNLFLVDSVASNPQFTHATAVPLGFADSSLSVPRPTGTLLYLKLRDDPSAINTAALPVLPEP